ncbi:MAG: DNA polymerase III subunit epsilon [Pseudomonadota bacterium]
MRQIILDTETTGLEPQLGHRIIEIGCVELLDRRASGEQFHCYLNPEREIDDGAVEVHGITVEQLKEKPRFADIAIELVEFIKGSELVIHNAPFDVGFIDAELAMLGGSWGQVADYASIFDTLTLARQKHPGQRNGLDALCKRYEIDNSHRTLHGALLDAEILAEVYLAMTGGQSAFDLPSPAAQIVNTASGADQQRRRDVIVVQPNAQEWEEHERKMIEIDESSGGRSRRDLFQLGETAPAGA